MSMSTAGTLKSDGSERRLMQERGQHVPGNDEGMLRYQLHLMSADGLLSKEKYINFNNDFVVVEIVDSWTLCSK